MADENAFTKYVKGEIEARVNLVKDGVELVKKIASGETSFSEDLESTILKEVCESVPGLSYSSKLLPSSEGDGNHPNRALQSARSILCTEDLYLFGEGFYWDEFRYRIDSESIQDDIGFQFVILKYDLGKRDSIKTRGVLFSIPLSSSLGTYLVKPTGSDGWMESLIRRIRCERLLEQYTSDFGYPVGAYSSDSRRSLRPLLDAIEEAIQIMFKSRCDYRVKIESDALILFVQKNSNPFRAFGAKRLAECEDLVKSSYNELFLRMQKGLKQIERGCETMWAEPLNETDVPAEMPWLDMFCEAHQKIGTITVIKFVREIYVNPSYHAFLFVLLLFVVLPLVLINC